MTISLFLLLLTLIFTGCVGADATRQTPYHARYFKELDPGRAAGVMTCPSCPGVATQLVELDRQGRPTGDTIHAWVEHVPRPGLPLSKEALGADLIISCYPRAIGNPHLRNRHVFPDAPGRVYFNYVGRGYIVATDRAVNLFRFITSVQTLQR